MSTKLRMILRMGWIGYAVGLVAVGLMSGLIGLLASYLRVGNLSMLYLIVVLAIAVTFGRGPAILVSAASFLSFNWFFVEPLHTFVINAPSEWVALSLFLLTAVITGQLAAGQRLRRQEAERREREAIVLYDIVRLMSDPDLDHALYGVAERLHREFHLAAVSIELRHGDWISVRAAVGETEALRLVQNRPLPAVHVLSPEPPLLDGQRGVPGHWIRIVPSGPPGTRRSGEDRLLLVPVTVRGRDAGNMLLVRHAGAPGLTMAEDRLLSAVATQLRLAVERTQLKREATEAEILRRADELKTALLNAVSHDLRTPLSSIMASAGSLQQDGVPWTEEERLGFIKEIQAEALRLNRIVENLLSLSRIEDGNLRPEKDWYDLGALLDDVLGRLRAHGGDHGIAADFPDNMPPVFLDYIEIDQVLSNLLENALKYTTPGTEIRISVRSFGKEIRIEIADQGPGIAPGAFSHLFEPFYRAGGKGRRPRGIGLGLAVAKGLVEAHGGRIWAENRPGGGACFVFTLPLTELGGAVAEAGGPNP